MDRISSQAELLDLAAGDPWVRWGLPDLVGEPTGCARAPAPDAWFDGHVAVIRRERARTGFWISPLRGQDATAERIRAAVEWLAGSGELEGAAGISVVQPHVDVVEDVLDLGDGGDWHWMWTTSEPPADRREAALVALDDSRDGAEISDFSHANNPRVWTEIGTGAMGEWLGLRDASGALIAVGGTEKQPRGVPSLAGIVTARGLRGQGLGAVVTAALTRQALAASGACTLGVFSDNTVALRLYARLGYRTGRAWSSRRLAAAG